MNTVDHGYKFSEKISSIFYLTPLEVAAEFGYLEVVKKFIKHYGNPTSQLKTMGCYQIQLNHGIFTTGLHSTYSNAIQKALQMGHHDIVKELYPYIDKDEQESVKRHMHVEIFAGDLQK